MNRLFGGSRSIDVGERSAVGLNLMAKACPPMVDDQNTLYGMKINKRMSVPIAFADPGSTIELVTPPDILRA